MTNLLNPYIAGAPVVESSMFFGRQDVFEWIERSLAGKYVDHILVIHGQRRVGKTSVLKQIPHYLSDRYIQVYLDLQGRAQTSLDRFLWWISREILRSLRNLTGVIVTAPEQSAFTQDPDYFHNQFLPALKPVIQDRILLLTFDEFDILSQPETMHSVGRPLTDYLSRLFELENLNFIFSIGSSGKKLENMQAAYTEFFKAALYKKISFLEQADCYRLITQPVFGVLSYDPGAVQRIYQITSGHPYYTQLICHELFSACQKKGKRRITRLDVEAILPDVVERGTVNLKFVWDEAGDLEKWVLASLAQTEGVSDIPALAAELGRQRVRFSEPELNSAALHLQEKDVLHPDLGFIVHLLRLWLQANRPLGRVREELQEINPIADRFIEIGDEYKDRGSSQEAVQSYQQALSVDPANLRAQLSIGAVHLAQADYPQAAEAYERALAIDPEDIQARTGTCQAHLDIGDQALANGDTDSAIDHLRRVVDINPDHSEVRQRLADILCQQAEQMLAQERDEDALKAIHAAHQYAPDDEALLERYNQVCSQVKGRVLASLLEKASAEWKRQNWSQAIACLEEYLEFEPEAAEVRTRLADLRRQERLSRLSALKAQAQGMAKAERWPEATAAWQDYLALEPEDRLQAEKALQEAQRCRVLAESYAQAQAALHAKEYSRAIQVLQSIITQQPSYKDTARLLAEAIVKERARQPVWKQPWIWAALVLVILVAISGIFGRDMIGSIFTPGGSPQPSLVAVDPQTTPLSSTQVMPTNLLETMPAIQATQPGAAASTTTPDTSATLTPDPAWITNFGEPALNYLAQNDPDFEDDFSEARPEWRLSSWPGEGGEKSLRYADYVTDSAFRLDIDTRTSFTLHNIMFDAFNFAMQYDFIEETGGDANPSTIFRANQTAKYDLFFSPIGKPWNWAAYKLSQELEEILAQDYSQAIGYQKRFTVLLIAHEDQFAVYFNDQPAGYFQDSALTGEAVALDFPHGSAPARVVLDNVKFWKLPDDLALAPAPAWVESFVQPLMEQIEGKTPDFQDDFSEDRTWTNSYGMPVEKSGAVEGGSYRLSVANGETTQLFPRLATDFVLEIDFQPDDLKGEEAVFALNLRGGERSGHYRFEIDPQKKAYRLSKPSSMEGSVLAEGALPSWTPGSSASLKALVSGSRLAFLWNDAPLASVTDNLYKGAENQLALSIPSGSAAMEIDEVKLWDLNPVELPVWVETFAKPLLNIIRDRPPDFEDDFSTVKPEWMLTRDVERGEIISIEDYVRDGVLRYDNANAKSPKYQTLYSTRIQAHDFVLQFDFSADNYASTSRREMFNFNKKVNGLSIEPLRNECEVGQWETSYFFEKTPCTSGSWKEPNQIIILSSGDRFGVYLNGEPLGYVSGVPDTGLNNYFWLGGYKEQATYVLDNLKFWNLDSQ